MLYRVLIRPLLYFLPAESAHHVGVFFLRVIQALPPLRAWVALLFHRHSRAPVHALGTEFPNPVGLAAGFDKDARVYPALGAMGFGFVEVGTITGEPQPGNPTPRLFRLPPDRALVNRMGFNNRGADDAARRLARALQSRRAPLTPDLRKAHEPVLGINIGKTKLVEPDKAALDYEKSARLLAPFADYFVVNVSSPNTPGLRDLQAVESLEPILTAVRTALDESVPTRRVPLLVKIAPDLNDADVRAVAQLCLRLKLEGIIATNTTISREGLASSTKDVESCGAGGLSGAPLKARALQVLRLLHREVGPELTLIAAGGIESAQDAWQRILSGASLVQVYTALIYQGPTVPSRFSRDLDMLLEQSPFDSWEQAIGSAAVAAEEASAGAPPAQLSGAR